MNISPRRIAQQVSGLWVHSGKVDWDQWGAHLPKRRTSRGWKAMKSIVKTRANRMMDRMAEE